MVRSLWTAASGMNAQQISLDSIANNLANVNSAGYKSEQAQFKSLLYQNLQKNSTTSDGSPKPVGIQVGLGVRNSAIVSQFEQGPVNDSDATYDFAIEGDGFFCIQMPDGSAAYTRSGNFNMGISNDGNWQLCTADGRQVLGTDGNPIQFTPEMDLSEVFFTNDGYVMYENEGTAETINQFRLAQFNNPAGLQKLGGTLFEATAASGDARYEDTDTAIQKSKVLNGYIESSNVNVATEMVNMIITQRAYELNSKAITASDTMLQQANSLRS